MKKYVPNKKLATDDGYKHRWFEWYMADGTMLDSRNVNWRHIHWEKVVKIVMHIREHVWELACENNSRFQYFLCFRKQIITGSNKESRWVMGWSDGETAHLRDFSFKTGGLVREYKLPMSRIPGQIHPRVGGTVVSDVAEA